MADILNYIIGKSNIKKLVSVLSYQNVLTFSLQLFVLMIER